MCVRGRSLLCWALAVVWVPTTATAQRAQRIQVKVQGYDPYGGQVNFNNLVCYRLMREDPTLEVIPYQQMTIQGGPGAEAGRYMAQAANMGPDVTTWLTFHNIRSYVRQGFFLPLNEFIGDDLDGDGYVSGDEATRWPQWKRIPQYYRRVATVGGKIYGIPNTNMGMAALLYRKDLFRKAGLAPDTPPRDFDELYRALQALTRPELKIPGARLQRGRRGIAIEPQGWQFCAWVWAAGGDLVMQGKTNPETGKTHWYAQEEMVFRDPDTDESLIRQPSTWKATFGGEGGMRALEFYRRLRFAYWIRHPDTQQPIDLTPADVQQGRKTLADGTTIRFSGDQVIEGVARVLWGSDQAAPNELLRRGEVAMIFHVCEPDYFRALDIPTENIGFWPVPPARAGLKPAMLAQYHYKALNASLAGEENRVRRQKAWTILSTMTGQRGARWEVEQLVKAGLAKFLDPTVLERAGLDAHLDHLPTHWRDDWKRALSYARTEPFEGFWPPIKVKILNNDVLSLALTQRDFDWRQALVNAQRNANTGLMFSRSDEEMARYRPWGWAGVALGGLVLVLVAWKLRQALLHRAQQGDVVARRGRYRIAWAPILLLAPALLLVALWKYYPLVRGGLMAFQDYKISGECRWVGVDNFINVVLDKNFWIYMRQTFKFVFLSIVLGFCTPIVLAVLLAEVPRGKIFFRTLFFLPQVSSGLVILFLWKMFYDPTAGGFLNKLFWFTGPIDWLGDPKWAMVAVILPGVWAGAGIGSLIYLAAMKSIPNELYEAAEVDGAGMWQKVLHVTIPSLLPLFIISFVGAFIGTFHAMGNIFAMTAGGPGNETMVMSLAIWYEAFAFLRFGTATAMAWILGSLLIGFTLMQLRILRRVEFRRAAID